MWIVDRLKEPSTWRGLAAIVAMFGIQMSPEQMGQIMQAFFLIYGTINVIRKEKKV